MHARGPVPSWREDVLSLRRGYLTLSSMAPHPPHTAVVDGVEGAVVVVRAVVAMVVVNTPPRTMEWGDLFTLLRIHRIIWPTQMLRPIHLDRRFHRCAGWVQPLLWPVHHEPLTRIVLALALLSFLWIDRLRRS